MSQNNKILAYLESGKSLTHRQASDLFGCDRLAARIHELKRMGHPIKCNMVERVSRDGITVKFAEYFI